MQGIHTGIERHAGPKNDQHQSVANGKTPLLHHREPVTEKGDLPPPTPMQGHTGIERHVGPENDQHQSVADGKTPLLHHREPMT